jgi:hypothetical protein
VAQEIVKRQFMAYENQFQEREKALSERQTKLNNKQIELEKIAKGEARSKKELADKIKELEEEALKFERMSNTDIDNITFDKHEIKYGVEALVARARRDILKWTINQK